MKLDQKEILISDLINEYVINFQLFLFLYEGDCV